MRNWSSQRVVVLGLCAALLLLAARPSGADSDVESPAPAGDSAAAEEPDLSDEEFDDAFELELARTSDMQRLDPFENANRAVFAFNEKVIDYFFDPVMVGYRFIFPSPVRKGLRQVYENLNSPRILVNDLLQLRFRDAGETLGRFVLNSAFGFGGLFDVAVEAGWERHDSDFGQTLGKMGVASGPYLMIPAFGPATVRDAFGNVVDLAFQPLAYILGPAEIMLQVYIGSGNGLTVIDANHDKLQALEDSSIDYYAALRSAYLQSRRAAIADARSEPGPGEVETGDASIVAAPDPNANEPETPTRNHRTSPAPPIPSAAPAALRRPSY